MRFKRLIRFTRAGDSSNMFHARAGSGDRLLFHTPPYASALPCGRLDFKSWVKVMLHWSTCNANLQRRFATHVFRTNLQTCYTFESLSKTSNALQHCKYRKESSATGCYTRTIFRATSYHCKLALQVDQCNIAFPAQNWRIQGNFSYLLSRLVKRQNVAKKINT